MSKEIKDIPSEELARIQTEAVKEFPKGIGHYRRIFGEEGYIRGASAEYLRHLSLSSKPGIGPNGFPGDTVLAIQWDGTAYTWWILNKAEMPFENGPMGGRTFFLKINDDEKIQISPGDWVVKDKAGKFHRCESIPSSEPAKSWVKEKYNEWLKFTGLDKDSHPALVALNCIAFLMYDSDPTALPEPPKESRPHPDGEAVAFADWIIDKDYYKCVDGTWIKRGDLAEYLTTPELLDIFRENPPSLQPEPSGSKNEN